MTAESAQLKSLRAAVAEAKAAPLMLKAAKIEGALDALLNYLAALEDEILTLKGNIQHGEN